LTERLIKLLIKIVESRVRRSAMVSLCGVSFPLARHYQALLG